MEYECSICGRKHVKLWRPYVGAEPLICASCAEKRQVPREYDECVWEEKIGFYIGKPTGKKLPLPMWTVNENGEIPSHHGPRPDGTPMYMTDQLLLNTKDLLPYDDMIFWPAIPNKDGIFIRYPSKEEKYYKWWESLPTR